MLGRDLQRSPTSPGPAIKLTRPTVRRTHTGPAKGLRPASSMDNMYDEDSERTSPYPRPPSRTGSSTLGGGIPRPTSRTGVRPSSRTGMSKTDRKTASLAGHNRGQRFSRSAQPSPSHR